MVACALVAAVLLGATAPPETPRLQLPDGVRPLRYVLDLTVLADRDGFEGTVAIELELAQAQDHVWLHARDLRVAAASVETASGRVAATLQQVTPDGVAQLRPERPIGPGRATLRVAFSGGWADTVGLFLSRDGEDRYVATQFEAIDARRAFPCFDEPRFKTPFDVTLTVRAADVAVSNGPALAEAPAGPGRKRVRFATTPPLPTYLVFAAAGPFDVVAPPPLPPTELRPHALPIRFLVPRGRGGEVGLAVAATRALVPWYERWFGLAFPYPKLDQIALDDFAGGGMENAGAIAYESRLLLLPAGSAASSELRAARAVAHELAHQWFGDLVTPTWWTDIWLNESFATWIVGPALTAWRPDLEILPRGVATTDGVLEDDARASALAVRQPLADLGEVDAQFNAMSYGKGAALLRMTERYAGPEAFRRGISTWLARHANGAGDTPSLLEALSAAAGKDVGAPLRGFLDRPGFPLVRARIACGAGGATLRLHEERYRPHGSGAKEEAWLVPVCARWGAAGKVREGCTLLAKATGELPLGEACPDWLLPNAGAAGYYRWALPPADLRRLVAAAPRLTAEERVALPGAIRAAQRAGALPPGDALAALAAIASGADDLAATQAIGALDGLAATLLPPQDPALGAWARAALRPALRRVGLAPRRGEPPAASPLRGALVSFLGVVAGDPEIAAEGARFLPGFLADPAGATAAASPELAGALLAVAIHARPDAFGPIAAELGHAPRDARSAILRGLVRSDVPATRAQLVALWSHGGLDRPARGEVLFLDDPPRATARDALAAALERDFDGVLAAMPAFYAPRLPALAGEPCAPGQEQRLRALFAPRLGAHPELRLALDDAVETARLCLAWRAADGRAARAWLAREARR